MITIEKSILIANTGNHNSKLSTLNSQLFNHSEERVFIHNGHSELLRLL